MTSIKGFIAYASKPSDIGATIENAISFHHLSSGESSFQSWKQNDIAGRFLIEPVLENIRDSECLIADISTLNFNVAYEVGFAIGVRRRVFLNRNRALESREADIKRIGIFDTLGFVTYENAFELQKYLATLRDFGALAIDGPQTTSEPVYLLQYPFNTDAQGRIVARVKKARLRYKSFDPTEQSRLSADEAIRQVSGSLGVIIPLAPSSMQDAQIHNIRAAFVAGLAHGMNRATLILQNGHDPVPLDYRDLVKSFRHPDDLNDLIGEFALEVTEALQARRPLATAPRGFLATLDLGASTAENEFANLASYYLPTDQYQRTLRGEARIVAGRKGSGKTAIFSQVRDRVRANRSMIVLDLKPEGYQLKKLKEQILMHLEEGTKEHTITAFWEYILLLEIAYKILEKDRVTHLKNHRLYEPYQTLARAYSGDDYSREGDFSERMLRLVESIADSFGRHYSEAKLTNLSRRQVTEIFYSHDIKNLRGSIENYLKYKDGLWILFDNIDKGWATNGVSTEDVLMVRCLLEASRKLEQEFRAKEIDCHAVIFIRNDVYARLVNLTPDRGKEALVSLDWSEPDLLREVLRRRLQYNELTKEASFEDLWGSVCVGLIDGEDSAQYLIDRSLMRPRFLLKLVSHCKSNAVNLGHDRIEQSDIRKGVAAFSTDLIYDVGFEIRDVLLGAEDVLYALLGKSALLSYSEVGQLLSPQYDAEVGKQIIEVLLWYGVFGVRRESGEISYIRTVNYDMKRLLAILSGVEASNRVLYINPAFWAGLEIVPQPLLI